MPMIQDLNSIFSKNVFQQATVFSLLGPWLLHHNAFLTLEPKWLVQDTNQNYWMCHIVILLQICHCLLMIAASFLQLKLLCSIA